MNPQVEIPSICSREREKMMGSTVRCYMRCGGVDPFSRSMGVVVLTSG